MLHELKGNKHPQICIYKIYVYLQGHLFYMHFSRPRKKNFGRFLASKNVNLNFSQTSSSFVTILNPSWFRCYVFRFSRVYVINKQWESDILINVPTSPLSQPAPLSPTALHKALNLYKTQIFQCEKMIHGDMSRGHLWCSLHIPSE